MQKIDIKIGYLKSNTMYKSLASVFKKQRVDTEMNTIDNKNGTYQI